MNRLVDESVGQQIGDRLRQDGHSLVYVTEEAPGAMVFLVGNEYVTGQTVYVNGGLYYR
jgi:hypothetical protein